MAEEKSKLIPFSRELEEVIEADAKRCRRSFVRQVEAVLMTYYGIEDVEVDRERLVMLGEIAKNGRKSQIIEVKNKANKKKRSA
jgi:hypothetical protein